MMRCGAVRRIVLYCIVLGYPDLVGARNDLENQLLAS